MKFFKFCLCIFVIALIAKMAHGKDPWVTMFTGIGTTIGRAIEECGNNDPNCGTNIVKGTTGTVFDSYDAFDTQKRNQQQSNTQNPPQQQQGWNWQSQQQQQQQQPSWNWKQPQQQQQPSWNWQQPQQQQQPSWNWQG